MRLLLVEDHELLADTVAGGLRREGIAVDVVHDGREGLARSRLHSYDVIVLDRDLPEVHGDEVCRVLVADRCESRVLMLTAADAVEDRIAGLGLGADDYLSKPFDFGELVARVRALARRRGRPTPPTLVHGDLTLDPAKRVAVRGGRRLALRPKEFGVLEYLLSAEGRVVSAEELLHGVWDEQADPFSSAVKNTVSRLRAELGTPPLIETLRDAGYRIG